MKGEAAFSECGCYRWWLTRVWDESLPMACLIGMNPSTATATEDDPTIGKEITYVRSWEFGGMLKLNAFAYRATKPEDLEAARKSGIDIIGLRENSAARMIERIREAKITTVVACWGKLNRDRGWSLRDAFTAAKINLDCLKINLDGSPAHPLYLPSGLLLEPWNYSEES